MELTRRSFAQTVGLGLVGGAAGASGMLVSGCNASGVWGDLKAWIPVGIASFESIALLFPGSAPIIAAADTAKAAFAVLSAAVDQYLNAPASEKQGWLAKVELAFNDVTSNIQAFLTAIGSTGSPVVKLALSLANIILSTIAAFISKIGPTPAPVTLRAGNRRVDVVATYRSRKQFVSDFNAACVAEGHPELEIH